MKKYGLEEAAQIINEYFNIKRKECGSENDRKYSSFDCGGFDCETCIFDENDCTIDMFKNSTIEKIENYVTQNKKIILSGGEKLYLENALKPFKNQLEYVVKLKGMHNSYVLLFKIIGDMPIVLPPFVESSKYSGMLLNLRYSAYELGLWQSEVENDT